MKAPRGPPRDAAILTLAPGPPAAPGLAAPLSGAGCGGAEAQALSRRPGPAAAALLPAASAP